MTTNDTWTKIEEAKHFLAGIDPDELQKIFAAELCLNADIDSYEIPFQNEPRISTTITVTIDGTDYDIHDYAEAHPEDIRVAYERCSDSWYIAAIIPFRVLVRRVLVRRPHLTTSAVWEFRHVA
jgi:hypothetical protein